MQAGYFSGNRQTTNVSSGMGAPKARSRQRTLGRCNMLNTILEQEEVSVIPMIPILEVMKTPRRKGD